MAYRIRAYRRMAKDLDSIPRHLRDPITQHIRALANDPRPSGVARLQGRNFSQYYRLRVGDYRIVYRIDDAASVVEIMVVAHRRDVYDLLGRR